MSRSGRSTTEPWPSCGVAAASSAAPFWAASSRLSTAIPSWQTCLLDPYFTGEITRAEESWRRVCAAAITHGIPLPGMTSGLSYFDGYRSESLPANLLQAQRDFFGAHTYERVDRPRGQFFHTNWTGRGGTTASTSYNV